MPRAGEKLVELVMSRNISKYPKPSAGKSQRALSLIQFLLYQVFDAFFWDYADRLFYCLSVLEYEQCRDAHDVEA